MITAVNIVRSIANELRNSSCDSDQGQKWRSKPTSLRT